MKTGAKCGTVGPDMEIVMRTLLSFLLIAAPTAALAHAGHGDTAGLVSGFLHPVGGLDHVLAMVAVDGLEASGTVSGRLPVRIATDSVHLDGGLLEADAPGTLRYDPENPPGFLKGEEGSPTALLMGALTDFRYDTLSATVDGQAGGELAVGIAIRGSNPAFYDGYPVALNLKVSGALDRILRQSLDTYRIPETVRDRMTEFQRRNP